MDKQEAKLILQSYRFDSQDAKDPAFADALSIAQNDPELRAWFEHERASDEAISTKIRQAPVPPDLRKTIISGLRSEAAIIRPAFVWWKSPALAWAAVITIIFAAAFMLQTKPTGTHQVALANYRVTMRENLEMLGLGGFDFSESQPVKIKAWLDKQELLQDVPIPATLADKKSMGCKLFAYNGAQAALICFQLPNMETVHLFMIKESAVGTPELPRSPTFAKCGGWDTCCWEKDGNLYLLLGKVGNNTLKMLASR